MIFQNRRRGGLSFQRQFDASALQNAIGGVDKIIHFDIYRFYLSTLIWVCFIVSPYLPALFS